MRSLILSYVLFSIGGHFICPTLWATMSKNCELCNELLTPSTIEGGRCEVCIDITFHDLHTWTNPNTATPAKGDSVKQVLPVYALSISSASIKEGFTCSYCEDVYDIDDMNNTLDRWLCNQCYIDHVVNE